MTARSVDKGFGGGTGRDYGFLWCLALGIGMIAVGLLGLPSNPLVGEPSSAWGVPLFLTGNVLDVIHLVTGAVLLYGGLGLTARRRATLLIGVGAIQLVLFLVGLISGDLFGALRYHASALDQLLLLAIASINVGVGYVGRGGTLDSLRRRRTTGTGAIGDP